MWNTQVALVSSDMCPGSKTHPQYRVTLLTVSCLFQKLWGVSPRIYVRCASRPVISFQWPSMRTHTECVPSCSSRTTVLALWAATGTSVARATEVFSHSSLQHIGLALPSASRPEPICDPCLNPVCIPLVARRCRVHGPTDTGHHSPRASR